MPTVLSPETDVELPGGLALEDGRVLRRATLRPLTGREEEWLADHPGIPNAAAADRILAACVSSLDDRPFPQELLPQLLVADRDYLLWQVRRMMLGEQVAAVYTCPLCSALMDVDFAAGDVLTENAGVVARTYAVDVGGGKTVRFRLPTAGDQAAALGLEDEAGGEAILARCLLDPGLDLLPDPERAAVAAEMERLAPRFELELDLVCPECGHAFMETFDTTAFFLSELRTNSRQLLYEVHSLAFYYHWSEAEILGLTQNKRRAYLTALAEALRTDRG